MKKLLLLIFLIVLSFSGWSQQIAQYSQWSFNQFSINPALAGIKRCLDIRTAVRAQWAGFEGAPISGLVTINAPLQKREKRYNDFYHGIGGKLERDAFGSFNNFSISLAYAIHFPIGIEKNHHLSFGVSLGVQQFEFDPTKSTTIEPDPAVSKSANNLLFPLIGLGAWYNSKHFYAGAAVDQLAKNKWKDVGFASRFRLHTKLAVGTKFTFSNDNSILPGLLFRIPPTGPVSFDINAMFDFKNKFTLGVGYRNVDAFIGFLKVNIKQFTIGYSFDYITSDIRGGNFHTHEISIQYNGCRRGKRSKSACPLFE